MYIYNGSQLNKADSILRHTIRDKSLLERAFNLDQEKKYILFNSRTATEGIEFMTFLQWNYREKEIVQLFENINTEKIRSMIVQRTFKIYKSLSKSYVYHNFKKVNNNFVEIYNELARLKPKEKYWEKPSVAMVKRLPKKINNINYHPPIYS